MARDRAATDNAAAIGLLNATLLAIPLWGAIWYGSACAFWALFR
jgi:hypothetical protein